MQKYLVIGFGTFGMHIAKSFREYGSEVTGLDHDPGRLKGARDYINHSITGDAADRSVLEKLSVPEFDGIVVALGDTATNILVTTTVKDLGGRHITARASSENHCRILEKLDVFDIIFPDRDAATRAGKALSMKNVLDYIPLTKEYVVMNIHPPASFIGRTIRELSIGARFKCQILGIKYGQGDKNWVEDRPEWENMKIAPTADDVIPEKSLLMFLGRRADLRRIQEMD